MTPEIEKAKRDLFATVAAIGPREVEFLHRCFRSLRPSEDEPEVREANEIRQATGSCASAWGGGRRHWGHQNDSDYSRRAGFRERSAPALIGHSQRSASEKPRKGASAVRPRSGGRTVRKAD
jgi:hypothetical protein